MDKSQVSSLPASDQPDDESITEVLTGVASFLAVCSIVALIDLCILWNKQDALHVSIAVAVSIPLLLGWSIARDNRTSGTGHAVSRDRSGSVREWPEQHPGSAKGDHEVRQDDQD